MMELLLYGLLTLCLVLLVAWQYRGSKKVSDETNAHFLEQLQRTTPVRVKPTLYLVESSPEDEPSLFKHRFKDSNRKANSNIIRLVYSSQEPVPKQAKK